MTPERLKQLQQIVDSAAFKLQWYADLDAIETPEALVKGLLTAGSLIVVYGESNSGKSFFGLDIGLSIARACPWRGKQTRGGLVLYIAGEGGASVRARVKAYRTANSDLGGLPFALIPHTVNLLSLESVTALSTTVREAESATGEKSALVVIDTLARAMPGGDENSAEDMGAAVAAADRIRLETGTAVMLIHHAGKDVSKGARGSSALRAATDTEILVEGQSGQRTATVTKQRDLESGEVMPFELVPVQIGTDADNGAPITSCVVRHLDAKDSPPAKINELKGKAQRQLLALLRARKKGNGQEAKEFWTLYDLRKLGTDNGMHRSTANSVVDYLVTTPYMQGTVAGYRFTDGAA